MSNFLRLLWIAIGIAAGISLALWLVHATTSPLFLASLGGSAVFLFGMTRAPAAQPRALLGGHLIGALVGITCYQLFGDALWVYAVAAVVAGLLLLVTKTVHPPAGANSLIMVHAHASWQALLQPVLLGVVALALVTCIWSRIYPRMVRYPVAWFERSPPSTFWGGWD